MSRTERPATAEEIDAAILAALGKSDGGMRSWAQVRRRLPGSLSQRAESLVRLFESAQVNVIKIGGRNYVSLADEFAKAAAKRGRPRMLVL